MAMCTCNPNNNNNNNNNNREEYYTALSEFETSSPEDLRTSTRYYEGDFDPEYTSTPIRAPIRTPTRTPTRQDYQRNIPQAPIRSTLRRSHFTAGVAIVPRRIDFDATSEAEDVDVEEDMGEVARETLEQLRNAAQRRPNHIPEPSRMHRFRRTRATQYPSDYRRQVAPRMVRITPCGKCLRI